MIKTAYVIPVYAAAIASVFAQAPDGNSAPPVIATDRPAVTDSSAVVPYGVLVVENGFLDTAELGHSVLDFPESLVRLGVGPSTEVRFTLPDYYQDSATGQPSGFGDIEAGMKQQIPGVPWKFQVAVVLSLSFPTGARAISSHGYDPSVQVPWSRALSSNWTAAGMLSVYAPTQNGSHTVIGETTFLLDRQLTKAWDAFTEYAGDFPEAGGPRHLLHFGTAYKIGSRQQVDVHYGIGLSSAAVDHFVGFGYSFLFQLSKR
jgi:hypothetical protein